MDPIDKYNYISIKNLHNANYKQIYIIKRDKAKSLNHFFLSKKMPNKFWIKNEIKICDRAKIQGKKLNTQNFVKKRKICGKKRKAKV